jgi:tRNA A-37 threonylcarbamoyl transferase component Bud32
MLDVARRLSAALGARYTIERELGHGGAAVVYLAHDRKHDRQVAIKVLSPELALAVRSERFLREIQITAKLAHPYIMPLVDSGEADGFLYYVMPYVEGKSLRDRLQREKQLSLPDALRITFEVADALSYAHRQGVIHRDIKPENILLEAKHAVIADFGIARAIIVASEHSVTQTGVLVGTPAYMSPEQATGERQLDGRSDIYSLGCVLYEMLAGHPPFLGTSQQEVLSRHLVDPVPSLRAVRAAVPAALEAAIRQALTKQPADRFVTATEFTDALLAGTRHMPVRLVRTRVRRRVLTASALIVAAALGVMAVIRALTTQSRGPDPELVAVLPFRVTGDPDFEYLREGMVDLLAAKLSAEGGLRAVDPRTVIAVWSRSVRPGNDPSKAEGVQLAKEMGGGRVLLGEVVGTPTRLLISADIFSVPRGRTLARAVVEGAPDSLLGLVDQLVLRLLVADAGERGRRLADVTGTSLPAVKAYLAGRVAYRRGRLSEAMEHFTRALKFDSTIALAALGIAALGQWTRASESQALARGLRTGYALRSRLSPRDSILFEAYVGPKYPVLHSAAAELVGWHGATEAAPESPEAWYELGDRLFHVGQMLGQPNSWQRAELAFARALELDSTFAPALAHLVELAALASDKGKARRLAAIYFAQAADADAADYVRWIVAQATEDKETLVAIRGRFERLSRISLNRITGFGQVNGIGLHDVELGVRQLAAWPESPVTRLGAGAGPHINAALSLHALALNQGRPSAALDAVSKIRAAEPIEVGFSTSFFESDQLLVLDALFWDGDSRAGAEAARRVERRARAPLSRDARQRAIQYAEMCAAAMWRLAHGDTAETGVTIARLRAGLAPEDSASYHGGSPIVCHAMVTALYEQATGGSAARDALGRLDSLQSAGLYVFGTDFGNLVLARLYETRGNLQAALAALRRRPYDWDSGPEYLSTFLREEGRLAALTGDREGGIHAYRHYLALRSDPEPPLGPQVDSVRAELDRLLRTP